MYPKIAMWRNKPKTKTKPRQFRMLFDPRALNKHFNLKGRHYVWGTLCLGSVDPCVMNTFYLC